MREFRLRHTAAVSIAFEMFPKHLKERVMSGLSTQTLLNQSCPATRQTRDKTVTSSRRRPERCRAPVWRLAAGYRLMAWRALRRGDLVDAHMYAESSRALIATMPR